MIEEEKKQERGPKNKNIPSRSKEARAAYYQKNREKRIAQVKKSYIKNKARYSARKREALKQSRTDVFNLLGNVCTCCGESNQAFLTVDHINQDGHKDTHSGAPLRLKILRMPVDVARSRYQTLCFNCNCARSFRGDDGTCPHKLVPVEQFAGFSAGLL